MTAQLISGKLCSFRKAISVLSGRDKNMKNYRHQTQAGIPVSMGQFPGEETQRSEIACSRLKRKKIARGHIFSNLL